MTASLMFILTIVCFSLMIFMTILSMFLYKRAKDISPKLETLAQIEKEITIGNNTKDSLDEKIKLMSAEINEANRVIEKAEDLKNWINNNGGSVEILRNEINKAKLDFEQISKKLVDIEKNRDDLLQEIVELKKQHDELSIKINSSQLSLSTIIENIALKNQEKDRLESSLEQLNKTINEKTLQLNNLKEKIREKQAEQKIIEGKIKGASSTYDEVQKLIIEKNTAQRALSKIEENIAIAQGKEDSINNIWTDLDREVFDKNINPKQKDFSERKALLQFSDLLEKNNIKFNPRTINAFHTGLKAEDSSPLVVLSGISGTGKSLLPKLYSNFMGFNFLATAVQPRWDSPQDMLGFYNYMQKRYKATELARLLWQFDVYNNKQCKYKDKKANLPMNLVLLDEMNLARVEYYFSDMLSKLEIRRTVDKDNNDQRKAAELEIECGALENNKLARNLFVNNNTLFVGTMNEDETTQILSDKVIDRANVIRFGKPEKLQAKANTQNFSNSCENDKYLTLDVWKNSWCNLNNQSNMDELSKTIERINTQLEKVGRPFGHRVWNSVENYIRLYPEGPNSFNNALSDQIEMKILPKLNGLEMDSENADRVLTELGGEIERLGDKALIDAYNKAVKDHSNVFFQWRGVVR